MRIRCPYCKCNYDIRSNVLGEPIGNETLGYGWWLKCYKCNKKFWLSNTDVINFDLNRPIKADKYKKIKNIEQFIPKKIKKKNKQFKIGKYIIITFIIILISIYIYNKEFIKNLFYNNIISKINNNISALELTNVSYKLHESNGGKKLYICGYIVNKTKAIMSLTGLRVIMTNTNTSEMIYWNIEPDIKNLVPGDKIFFAKDLSITHLPENFQISVSIF